jgi:hypothetical protein
MPFLLPFSPSPFFIIYFAPTTSPFCRAAVFVAAEAVVGQALGIGSPDVGRAERTAEFK